MTLQAGQIFRDAAASLIPAPEPARVEEKPKPAPRLPETKEAFDYRDDAALRHAYAEGTLGNVVKRYAQLRLGKDADASLSAEEVENFTRDLNQAGGTAFTSTQTRDWIRDRNVLSNPGMRALIALLEMGAEEADLLADKRATRATERYGQKKISQGRPIVALIQDNDEASLTELEPSTALENGQEVEHQRFAVGGRRL